MDINPQERAKSTSEGLYLNDYIECLSLNVQGLQNLLAAFENLTPSNLLLNSEEGKDDELVKMQRAVDIVESMTKMGSEFNTLQTTIKNILQITNGSNNNKDIDISHDKKDIAISKEEKEIIDQSKILNSKEATLTMEINNAINENEKGGAVVVASRGRSTIAVLTSKIYQGASELYNTVGSKGSGDKTKLILTPVSLTILLDESNTLAAYLFGKETSEFICGFDKRNPRTFGFLKLLFVACILLEFLCLYETISPWFALTFLYFTLYCVFFVILPRNFAVYKLLLQNFTTLFGIYNVIGYNISMIFLFKFDLRIIIFCCLLFTMPINLLSDAELDLESRKALSFNMLFFLVLDFVVFYLALVFNWYNLPNLKDEIQFSFVHFTVAAYALSCLQNYFIFYLRVIFNAFTHPECMVTLSARISVKKLNQSEAFVIMATEKANAHVGEM